MTNSTGTVSYTHLDVYKRQIILLNGQPSTLEEIEKISIMNFHSAIFKETWEKDKSLRKNYLLVFTEE